VFADITHFSMVGFAYEGAAESGLNSMVRRQLQNCTPQPLDQANVSCAVRDPSGAELWISLRKGPDGQASLVTMNPAFAGESRVKVRIDGENSDPEYLPFEVGRSARFSGQATPIVFELADPSQATAAKPGADITVAISAFSFTPELYSDAAAYYAAQKAKGAKVALGAEAFIPSGMFFEKVGGALPDGGKRPVAYADFSGTVLKATLRRNAAGGGSFWSLLARTYDGATVDIVLDPASVKVEPKVGAIISGRFWLSAHVVPSP
jgi:hypothetical protein